MLSLPPGLKMYISTQPLDMRKSFDGLAMAVMQSLKHDPFSGHVYIFCNKRGDKIKMLYWDRNGYCIWAKRLERGVFRFPQVKGKSYTVTPAELSLLLEGIELTDRRRLRAY